MTVHLVAHTVPGRLLFTTWPEGLRVWTAIVGAAPGLVAACVMPDHVHLVCTGDVRVRLARALSGIARWRNHLEGRAGPLVRRLPVALALPDSKHQRRTVRYLHLNPCRDGLVEDPLAWPLSTHRDTCGLVVPPVVPPRRRPEEWHAYVSGDPSVQVAGTSLPAEQLELSTPEDVLAAVSAVTRTPLHRLGRVPAARALAVRAVGDLAPVSRPRLAGLLGLSVSTVQRCPNVPAQQVRVVARAALDARFEPLDGGLLTLRSRWGRYRRG